MPRIKPLSVDTVPELAEGLEWTKERLGFAPNSMLIMARRPEIAQAFWRLNRAIQGPGSTIDPQLRNMIAQMASRAAGCGYCMAHTAHSSQRTGISPEKEAALWEYETSSLFSEGERAALTVARGAAQVPNGVTDQDFAELKKHYTETQIVDIVAVIALFGFLNRFNDTMATNLESSPIESGKRFLAERGWSVGKHA